LDKNTAIKNSIQFIDSIRYNDKIGNSYLYVWVNTINGTMIIDPSKPELNGKKVWNFKDKNGKYLFREMFKIAKIKGEGYVDYYWPKLGSKFSEWFPKISFVKYFPQWNWIIGSGFYMDDIDSAISAYRTRTKYNIIHTIVNSLIFGIIITIISGFMFFFIAFHITSHLKKLSELSIKLAEEEVTPELKLPYSANDEIGHLISNFNLFINESYKLIKFKKTIEDDINLEIVYKRISDLLHNEFKIDKFTLFEINNSKNSMKIVYNKGEFCCKQDIFLDISICRAARTAKIINSLENRKICTAFTCSDTCKHICIPLIVGGNVGNILQVIIDKDGFELKTINRLSKFLKEAAPVVETKRLLKQLKDTTLKDPLTTLYNRRFLDESAEMLVATILRRKSSVGILMCDIDYFKKVNDIYGHNVGDRVLKEFAKVLKNAIRESDIAVRFGGEEFLVLLQDVDQENAINIAEKIRKDVEQLEIKVSGTLLKKTVSIGVSVFPDNSNNIWKCIKFSDIALYKAKELGRNRVIRFEKSMWNEKEEDKTQFKKS